MYLNTVRVSVCSLLLAGTSIVLAQSSSAPAQTTPPDATPTPAATTEQTPPSSTPAATPAPATTAAPAATSTPAATPAPAATPPPTETWSIGPIDFSGLVDGYYSNNFNHPASRINQLYNFDTHAQEFTLNMAKLSMAHTPDPIGFQVDFGFGRAFDIIHSTEKAPEIFRYIEQAYVSFKPAQLKGLQIDFGDFVTTAGAEVIETNQNWNYSRSILFAWAIPYYHFGLRTSFPIGKYFTGGVQLVNGWNNIEDNNTGKTLGLTETLTLKKFAWTNTYYVGPENSTPLKGNRNLYDTVLMLTPASAFNAYLNFDYGQNTTKLLQTNTTAKWYGVAAAAHVIATKNISFTPRVEWFKDADGFSTGTPQTLKEFTMTGEYRWTQGVLARLEFRRDWSNVPFFDRGAVPATVKNQNTVTLGVVGYFGPKR